jgi:hypothetical protein
VTGFKYRAFLSYSHAYSHADAAKTAQSCCLHPLG